jgi:hypothetical protein
VATCCPGPTAGTRTRQKADPQNGRFPLGAIADIAERTDLCPVEPIARPVARRFRQRVPTGEQVDFSLAGDREFESSANHRFRCGRQQFLVDVNIDEGPIREFGFTSPVLIDEEDGIIAGHGRVLAAHVLGRASSWRTSRRRSAYVLADNKLALNAGWDLEMLSLENWRAGRSGV